jgi:hypothetical protein
MLCHLAEVPMTVVAEEVVVRTIAGAVAVADPKTVGVEEVVGVPIAAAAAAAAEVGSNLVEAGSIVAVGHQGSLAEHLGTHVGVWSCPRSRYPSSAHRTSSPKNQRNP